MNRTVLRQGLLWNFSLKVNYHVTPPREFYTLVTELHDPKKKEKTTYYRDVYS